MLEVGRDVDMETGGRRREGQVNRGDSGGGRFEREQSKPNGVRVNGCAGVAAVGRNQRGNGHVRGHVRLSFSGRTVGNQVCCPRSRAAYPLR